MKKAIFISIPFIDSIEGQEAKVKKYCERKGFIYAGKVEVDPQDIAKKPEDIIERIKSKQPDIIISDAALVTFAEHVQNQEKKKLLSAIESEGIAWLDYMLDQSVRETIQDHKENIDQLLKQQFQKRSSVIVLYKGNKNFEYDEEFKAIANYIRNKLK